MVNTYGDSLHDDGSVSRTKIEKILHDEKVDLNSVTVVFDYGTWE